MLKKLKGLKGKFRYDDSEMPFLEHLEEFRKMIIRVFIALVLGMAVAAVFVPQLIQVLRAPAEPYIIKNAEEVLSESALQLRVPADSFSTNDVVVLADGSRFYNLQAEIVLPEGAKTETGSIRLQFSEPAAAIKMWLTVAFFGGLLLSLPFVVFFIGLFVMPGVRDVERSVMTRISVFSGGLFLAGIYMGYKVTLPLALGLMLKIGGQLGGESIWFYNKYIGFALQLLLAFGVAFQMPVVILILGKMGLVSSVSLRSARPYVVVGIFVLAMVLTPPDVVTQILMAAPLILLYEFCIWFLYFSGNRDLPPKEVKAEEMPVDEPETAGADDEDVNEEPEADDTPEDDETDKKKDLSEE